MLCGTYAKITEDSKFIEFFANQFISNEYELIVCNCSINTDGTIIFQNIINNANSNYDFYKVKKYSLNK